MIRITSIPYASTLTRILPKTNWGRIALAIGAFAVAYFAKVLYQRWNTPVPSKIGYDFRDLLLSNSKSSEEVSLKPVNLFGATYIGYGLHYNPVDNVSKWFLNALLKGNEHQIIVDLRSEEERNLLNLKTENKTEKTVYILKGWKEGEYPKGSYEKDLIQLAKIIAKEENDKNTSFIFCGTGLQKTATFLAIVEFIRGKNQLVDKSDNGLCKSMRDILYAISSTAKNRVPSRVQYRQLLDPKFLRELLT